MSDLTESPTTITEPTEVTVAAGYLNDPAVWCYWETEYADEGSIGPFASRDEAIAHAVSMGYVVAEGEGSR